jgi:hypothetical protein
MLTAPKITINIRLGMHGAIPPPCSVIKRRDIYLLLWKAMIGQPRKDGETNFRGHTFLCIIKKFPS